MIELECNSTDPPHVHSFPDDWIFGGADESDPRADPRWKPTVYIYYGYDTREIFRTVQFICDDEALDAFTWVAANWVGSNPVWLAVNRPDGSSEMLPWIYNAETDLLKPAGT